MSLLVQLVGEVLAGAAALVVLAGLLLVVRLRSLTRRHGTFDCALRAVDEAGEGPWSPGVARTGSDGVRWWRSRSLSPSPRWSASRARMEVERLGETAPWHDVAEASDQGASIGGPSAVVLVRCRSGGRAVDLAMNDDAYTGFAAWLESLPPRDRGVVA